MSNMTPQEALAIIERCIEGYRDIQPYATAESDGMAMACALSALRASIPHIVTLAEARALEPHTAVTAEYRLYGSMQGPYYVGDILPKPDVDWPQYGRNVRWWTAWPDEEMRKATKWEAIK